MNVREKLVELLEPHVSGLACEYESGSCELTSCRSCNARNIADHLIAHGVTVQEWIPVTERLPVIGRSVIAYNAPAKCAAEAMYKGEGMFLQFRWSARLQDQEVTHWMPLPAPPKGE